MGTLAWPCLYRQPGNCQVLRCTAALRVPAVATPRPVPFMTNSLPRQALIRLHTLFRTWHRYEFEVHYCARCDADYDYWLGCDGCALAPGGGQPVFGLLELLWRRRP